MGRGGMRHGPVGIPAVAAGAAHSADSLGAAGAPGSTSAARVPGLDAAVRLEPAATGDIDLALSGSLAHVVAPAVGTDLWDVDELRLAFLLDRTGRAVGVHVRRRSPEMLELRVAGGSDGAGRTGGVARTDVERAVSQTRRVLSLDCDGAAFAAVAGRDSVLDGIRRAGPGSRPVLFGSPYEAACWAVVCQGLRTEQAVAMYARLLARYGRVVRVGGCSRVVVAPPAELRGAEARESETELGESEPREPDSRGVGRGGVDGGDTAGGGMECRAARRGGARRPAATRRGVSPATRLSARKRACLASVAEAAESGLLDAAALRAMEPGDAVDLVGQLPGIGPLSAELVVSRGAGHPDVFPAHDRVLSAAMHGLYGRRPAEVAERWRPYRSWASFLIRSAALLGGVRGGPSR